MKGAAVHTKSQDVEALAAMVHDAADSMSASAVAALVAHPDAVRSALAVAADVLSATDAAERSIEVIGGAETPLVDVVVADKRIAGRMRPATEAAELLTSDELAVRADLKTRQSVHDWLKRGRIVGWQGAKRGYVFPAGQLDDRGRPLMGFDRIVPYFADGYAAWIWLTTPRPSLDGSTPLALLRSGHMDRVAAAAEGDAQGDFA